MKFPVLLLTIALIFFNSSPSVVAALSSNDALKAIEQFQDDFGNAEGQNAIKTILDFAEKSSAVHISLSRASVPWLKIKADKDLPETEARNLLLAAYVAGNMKSQLKSGKAMDDPYAGWQQVLITYAQLRKINPEVKLVEVEDLQNEDTKGTLRAHAAEVAASSKSS